MTINEEAKSLLATRLFGCMEKCFQIGEQWGHLASILCKYLNEDTCDKYNEYINFYLTKEDRDNLE